MVRNPRRCFRASLRGCFPDGRDLDLTLRGDEKGHVYASERAVADYTRPEFAIHLDQIQLPSIGAAVERLSSARASQKKRRRMHTLSQPLPLAGERRMKREEFSRDQRRREQREH